MFRKLFVTAVSLLSLLFSLPTFSQTTNATLGGTVSDSSGALIPGVSITATNVATGIVTSVITNESGAYQFASLQPGAYKVSGELPGFQTQTYNDVQLGGSQQVRLNFMLQVGGLSQNVEVTIDADTVLATSSSSVGTVLPEQKVRDLPLPVRDVFGLLQATAGTTKEAGDNGRSGYFAGGRLSAVNTTRDGIVVSDGRYENGAWSATYTSPDLVEEVKVVVAPVDAETSRGSGQVSMVTRSGTNQYKGSVFWANRNSMFDANNWFNNQKNIEKDYVNRNQFGGRIGGPIIKNKTFFFFLFEGQRYLERENFIGNTLTDTARQGLFRFFPGVDNGNLNSNNPVVDANGNPVTPRGVNTAVNGGALQTVNLFGRDPFRTGIDQSAYMRETLARMPSPNNFTVGDGLNTAGIQFVRRIPGLDLANGNGVNVDRDQYNIRLDHNFNSKHKLSFIGTKEHTWGLADQAGRRSWPTAFDGLAVKRPDVYSVSLVSTLSNTLVNELRAGQRRTLNWQWGSADRGDAVGAEARSFLPVANGIPFNANPTDWTSFVLHGGFGRWREAKNPMRSLADNLSWTRGTHAFKLGIEIRRSESDGFNDPDFTPRATLGTNTAFAIQGISSTAIQGLSAANQTLAQRLLSELSGEISTINQSFGVQNAQDLNYHGYPTIPNNRHWWHQNEFSSFFKDEWKLRSNLTLNLGIHYEWFGSPYEQSGRAAIPVTDGNSVATALCGVSCGAGLTTVQFVGKNSTHPEIPVNRSDWNNFAPSVGFSWNLPWFGQDKTVLRAGYGWSYLGAVRDFIVVDGIAGTVPGVNLGTNSAGVQYQPTTFTTLSNVGSNGFLPIPTAQLGLPTTALQAIPLTADRSQRIQAYDRVSPYTQNWNLEIQRQIAKNTTVEVRYVGSKSTKLWGGIELNNVDIFNNGLLEAFNITRAGGNAALFDSMLNGLNIGGGASTVNGTTVTGSAALRANSTTRAMLANGNVGALANFLNTTSAGTGKQAALLRANGYPENLIVMNPQFGSVTLHGNPSNSTYHAVETQFTKRLTNGLSYSSTYTWSKTLGDSNSDAGQTYRDPRNRAADKQLLNFHHTHQLTSNGTYSLPFGPGRLLFNSAPGWLSRIVERWSLGGIVNWQSGAPLTLTSNLSTITNNTTNIGPNIVGNFPKSTGSVTKVANGVVYFAGLQQVQDPGIAALAGTDATFRGSFNNKAIADANGNILLVNPTPGTFGNLGLGWLEGPSTFNFDANLIKRVRLSESKEFEFRVDAVNVFNHANFGTPNVNINDQSNNFGRITTANAGRQFIFNARVNF